MPATSPGGAPLPPVTFEGRLYVAVPGLTDPVTGSAWGKNFVRLTGPNSLVWSMDRFSVKGRLKTGPAQFRSTATDGRGGSAVGTVTVTVNAAPVAVADAATTSVGVPVTIRVLANDTDANGNVLTVTAATQSPNPHHAHFPQEIPFSQSAQRSKPRTRSQTPCPLWVLCGLGSVPSGPRIW